MRIHFAIALALACSLASRQQQPCPGVGSIERLDPALDLLITGHRTVNCTRGDHAPTLYLTADDDIMRIQNLTKGTNF